MVHDIDLSRVETVCALGATPAENAGALAAECDIILLSLPNPDAVRQVVSELLSAAKADTLLIDCSTIDPDTSRWASTECEVTTVRYVEAPVTSAAPGGGSTEGAKAGNVTFLVGGEAAAVRRAAPIFELLGERHLHLGPGRCGQRHEARHESRIGCDHSGGGRGGWC